LKGSLKIRKKGGGYSEAYNRERKREEKRDRETEREREREREKETDRQRERGEDHASSWVHKDLTVMTKKIRALLTAARASGGQDTYQVRLAGIEREYWIGTEIGRLEGYGFRGTVTVGNGFNQKEVNMGAGYVNLQGKREEASGKWEEGPSSNRPALAAFVLTLRGIPITSPMFYLCNNQALLTAVKIWVGEGRKVTLIGAPEKTFHGKQSKISEKE